MTRQRKLVYEIIQKWPHITAEEIYHYAKERMPDIAMGTVYRNLGLMAEEGEILKIFVPHAADRYDKTVNYHDHAICVSCGKMVDIPPTGLKNILQEKLDKDIISYNLQVYYKCEDCRKNKKLS